jgi:hypothetical protein
LDELLERATRCKALATCRGLKVGWFGRRSTCRRRRHVMAWYHAGTHEIRVSRALDRDEIPAWYVVWILRHECLHHLIGWTGSECHPEAFVQAERKLPLYRRSETWFERQGRRLILGG